MKKILPIFGFILLFAAEAKALSCGSGQYLRTNTCGEGTEECVSCPGGCSSCYGVSMESTCQYYDPEAGVIHTTATVTSGSCNSCNSGYELKRYTTSDIHGNSYDIYHCDRKTTDSVTCPVNCSACSSSSICTSCKSGYILQNGQCVVKPACPSNCSECDDSGVCTKCESGYILKNGACAVKPKTQVAFCPPDKTLSADLCCCISK